MSEVDQRQRLYVSITEASSYLKGVLGVALVPIDVAQFTACPSGEPGVESVFGAFGERCDQFIGYMPPACGHGRLAGVHVGVAEAQCGANGAADVVTMDMVGALEELDHQLVATCPTGALCQKFERFGIESTLRIRSTQEIVGGLPVALLAKRACCGSGLQGRMIVGWCHAHATGLVCVRTAPRPPARRQVIVRRTGPESVSRRRGPRSLSYPIVPSGRSAVSTGEWRGRVYIAARGTGLASRSAEAGGFCRVRHIETIERLHLLWMGTLERAPLGVRPYRCRAQGAGSLSRPRAGRSRCGSRGARSCPWPRCGS